MSSGRGSRAASRLAGPGSPQDSFRFVRKAHAAALDEGERAVFTAIKRANERMEARVLRKLNAASTRKGTVHWDYGDDFELGREKKAVDPKKVMDAESEAETLVAEVMPEIENVYSSFGEGVVSTFGANWNLKDPGVAEDLLTRSNRLAGTVDTTWQAVAEAIVDAEAAGETIDGISKAIGRVFNQAKGYRARVIARTETVGAANAGALRGAHQSGVVERKVWLATMDHRTRSSHVDADGQAVKLSEKFSVGGHAMNAPGDPYAPASEVVNCRCLPGLTPVSLAEVVSVSRRPYEGHGFRVVTADGHDLTATPNHPVLTTRGWRAIGSLKKGDEIVQADVRHGTPEGDPEVDDGPVSIEQVFESAVLAAERSERIAGRSVDFHGDGAHGEVEVQVADLHLAYGSEPSTHEAVAYLLLEAGERSEMGRSDDRAPLERIAHPLAHGGRATPNRGLGVLQDQADRLAGEAEVRCDRLLRSAGDVAGDDLPSDGAASIPALRSESLTAGPKGTQGTQVLVERGHGAPRRVGQLAQAGPVVVSTSEVVEVEVVPLGGYVYNLQTKSEWYAASGIITHNCTMLFERDVDRVAEIPEAVLKRGQKAEAAIRKAKDEGKETHVQHRLKGGQEGSYTPARKREQDAIIEDFMGKAKSVPNEGKALFSGGLGGAGKGTVLKSAEAGVDAKKYLTIDPDAIKEAMAARGMVPKVSGLAPMEMSALIHEESSHIAGRLAVRATSESKNVIFDITMSTERSVQDRLNLLKLAGYTETKMVFVDIPVETSVERAMGRYARGIEAFENGEGYGGRYVPPDIIRQQADEEWGSKNRATFEKLKDQSDDWRLFDNSGEKPVLLEASD